MPPQKALYACVLISFALAGCAAGGETNLPAGQSADDSLYALCVSEINRHRATSGAPALTRWQSAESCAAGQARYDHERRRPHGAFGSCGEHGQNECPGWGGWSGDPAQVIRDCLQGMWDEGQGGGHHDVMAARGYHEVACGFFVAENGQVTAVQNFR